MRIGIDARTLLSPQYTGIARCVFEEICAWIRLYPQHEFFLFSCKKLDLKLELPSNWHIVDEPGLAKNGKLWFLFTLPQKIKEKQIDVFWGPSFALPRKNKHTRYYVTIYDLALFKFEGIGELRNTIRVKALTKRSCESANGIFAISKSTACDINEILHIPSRKIHTSYIGGLPTGYSKLELDKNAEINPILKFDSEYFLFISTIEPRKNIVSIVRAFELYKDKTGNNMKLVLAGKKGWQCEEIYKTVNDSKYKDDIVMPGFISDDDKAFLLSRASAFVYPSIYEGFGIPILEAFAYNLPVITTNVSSMPEVAGDAALYIEDPYDFTALSIQMENVIKLSPAERNAMLTKMQQRLEMFSWEKNAAEMMEIMEQK